MRLLLDTHAVAWALGDPDRLTPLVRDLMAAPSTTVFVSPVAPWEIATKHRVGKWREAPAVLAALETAVALARFIALPITITHARRAGEMAGVHRDPFDRMLAAQSEVEALSLVSADPAFAALGLTTVWSSPRP